VVLLGSPYYDGSNVLPVGHQTMGCKEDEERSLEKPVNLTLLERGLYQLFSALVCGLLLACIPDCDHAAGWSGTKPTRATCMQEVWRLQGLNIRVSDRVHVGGGKKLCEW
jgi:hypothetical protein